MGISSPRGVVLTAPAVIGRGGQGRLLEELVLLHREKGDLQKYFSLGSASATTSESVTLHHSWLHTIFKIPPIRTSRSWQSALTNSVFDRSVAQKLEPGESFIGLSGSCLFSLRRARKLGYQSIQVFAITPHILDVEVKCNLARSQYPIEQHWLNSPQIQRTILEYKESDRILVNSELSRLSLIQHGVDPEKIERFYCKADPRFIPGKKSNDGIFRVAYSGSLIIEKGTPLLIEAFKAAFGHSPEKPAELLLLGGSSSRGMRKYLQSVMASDPRIKVIVGDPLPHLQSANLYVHPSYQDGMAYSVLEALACGVPTILTQDTGAREYILPGKNGWVIPTGDLGALTEAIRVAHTQLQR